MTLLEESELKDNVQTQAQKWFTRVQSGELNDAEHASFKQWYADPAHASHYDAVVQFWDSAEFSIAVQRANQTPVDRTPMLITGDDKKRPQRFFNLKTWSIAASLFFILAINFNVLNNQFSADYLTSTGEQQFLKLEDGSKLTLNTDSAVKVTFDEQYRKINLLAGEIYLDVTKDSTGRPFRVYADNVLVEVLGTRFSVKQTSDGILINGHSGHIAVSTENHPPLVITAGERIQVKTGDFLNGSFDLNQEFSWLNNRLVFKDKPLKDVITELNRYYDGKFLLTNSKAAETRITGSYSLVDPVKTVRAISKVVDLKNIQITPWLTVIH